MYTQTVKCYRNPYLDKASFLHSLFKNETFIFIHQFLPGFVIFVDLNIIYIVHDIFTSIFYNEKTSVYVPYSNRSLQMWFLLGGFRPQFPLSLAHPECQFYIIKISFSVQSFDILHTLSSSRKLFALQCKVTSRLSQCKGMHVFTLLKGT